MAASAGEAVSLPISVTEGNNPDLFSGKPRIDPRSRSPADLDSSATDTPSVWVWVGNPPFHYIEKLFSCIKL